MRASFELGNLRRVVVGSTNPVKIAAVGAVLARCAPEVKVVGIAVASGVPDQPWGDDQTRAGAITRARAALEVNLHAELGFGIEGGVVEEPSGAVRTCAWAAVVDREGFASTGGSLVMPLPRAVVALLREGLELGHAMDVLAKTSGTKHGSGAVGLLTAGLIDRQAAYETLVTYALSPWLAPSFW